MTRARTFDPPLTYEEIGRVYDFTAKLMTQLGLAASWRIQITDRPCAASSYATIVPLEKKHIGEMSLNPGWMLYDLEGERIPTMIHEVLHLTHRELTDLITDDMQRWLGAPAYVEMHERWTRAIELWVDHMTQFVLGALRSKWEAWAEEIWGADWREIGDSTSAGQLAAKEKTMSDVG